MPPLRRFGSALLTIIIVAGCRRTEPSFAAARGTGYLVGPALVRVSSYAEAQFRYTADAVGDVSAFLRRRGLPADPRLTFSGSDAINTGAGASASGFIASVDGVIITTAAVLAETRDPASLEAELIRNGATGAIMRHFSPDVVSELRRSGMLETALEPLTASGSLARERIVREVELSNGQRASFEIIPPGSSNGLALLRIRNSGLPTLPLAAADAVHVGSSVWIAGYPAVDARVRGAAGWIRGGSDLEPSLSPGTVTVVRQDPAGGVILETSAVAGPGSRGGPVVDARGNVLAVVTGSNGALVSTAVARAALAEAAVTPQPSAFDRSYRRAVAAAAEGDWVRSDAEVRAAGKLFRGSPDVMRLSTAAASEVAAMPAWRRRPAGVVLAGALVALGAVIAAALAMRTRAQRRARRNSEIRILPQSRNMVVRREAPESRPPLGRFTILNGERAGEKLGLGGSGIRIGREPELCEIVLENPKVSRLHAEVVSVDGDVVLIDRHSSNGTWVNDEKIDRHVLRDGDIIYFGGRNAIAVAFHV